MRRGMELGIGLGLAAAAGLAGESGLSGTRLASLLDSFANDRRAADALAKAAIEHAVQGGDVQSHQFRDALAELMASVRKGPV